MYVPEQNDLYVYSRIYANGQQGGATRAFISFFPGKMNKDDLDGLKREFKRRIENPNENASFFRPNGFLGSSEAKPFPLKQKVLTGQEEKALECLLTDMKTLDGTNWMVHPDKVFYDQEVPMKKIKEVEAALTKGLAAVQCLQRYNQFYHQIYDAAHWVGLSQESQSVK